MRSFRFPRSAIFLMSLIFAATLFAIDQGRPILELGSGNPHFETAWTSLFGLFVFLGVLFCSIGLVGCLILFALDQSGVQRLKNIRTRV